MPLIRSIVKTLVIYWLIQCLGFFVFFRGWGFSGGLFLLFFAVQSAFYLGLFFFLVKNRRLFYRIRTGERETRVNPANKITLFRISMLPFLVFLTLASQGHPEFGGPALAAALALTFASDFFDGHIARTRGLETYIGKVLDSASDYLLLGVSAGAFLFFRLLKPWLFWVITGRLIFNSLVMLILYLVQKKLKPQTTFVGKTAIAVIMLLLIVEAARPVLPEPAASAWVGAAELGAALVIGLSVIDKFVYLLQGLQDKGK